MRRSASPIPTGVSQTLVRSADRIVWLPVGLMLLGGLLSGAVARAEPRVGALVFADSALGPDASTNLTLALMGALAAARSEPPMPVPELRAALEGAHANGAEACARDRSCVLEVKTRAQLAFLVLGTASQPAPGRLKLSLTRVEPDPILTYTRAREVDAQPATLARALRELVAEMLAPPKPVLLVRGEGPATVLVDDARVGVAPGTFVVSPGRHRIVLLRGEASVFDQEVPCPVGGQCSIEIPALPTPRPVTMPAPAPVTPARPSSVRAAVPPRQAPTGLRWAGYGTAGAGVVLLAVGTGFGVKSLKTRDEVEGACDGGTCKLTLDEARAKVRQGDRQARIATGLFIGGGLLAAGGLAMVLVDIFRPSTEGVAARLPILGLDARTGGVTLQHRLRF